LCVLPVNRVLALRKPSHVLCVRVVLTPN
jgi:hypothetical protein